MERAARLQDLYLHTSQIRHKNFPTKRHVSLLWKALGKALPSMLPKSRASIETDAISRALLSISFGVPSKGALPSGSPHIVQSERERDALLLEPLHPSLKVPSKWAFFEIPLGPTLLSAVDRSPFPLFLISERVTTAPTSSSSSNL